MARRLLLVALLVGAAATAPQPEEALASDDECLAAGGEDCALNAIQLRGQQVVGKTAGSCKAFGCNGAYIKSHDCQCTPECAQHGNCCADFQQTCAAGGGGGGGGGGQSKALGYRPVPSDCKSFGCSSNVIQGHSCQCDPGCQSRGNCCSDYAAACSAGSSRPGFLSMIPYSRSGVNMGGWFVLEDWFFSGGTGNHVMSMTEGQGVCLPPLLKNAGEKWPSEGILVKRLVSTRGAEETVKIFEAHRDTYITEEDFAEAAKLGIHKIRLPVPWYAFPEALSSVDPTIYNEDAKIVPDPFYKDEASFVTVSKAHLVKALQMASAHGMKVVIDMHNSPAGAQDGTYNGVWPMKPMFWLANSKVGKPLQLTEVGLMLASAMIKWTEQLGPQEFAAVDGLTLMNEPAHMAAIDEAKGKAFIRSESQVWDWIGKSSNLFRQSALPKRGKKLYVSLVETTWKDAYNVMPAWWGKAFSAQERHSWAVFDVHWYIAWSGDLCSGRTQPGGQFTCDMAVEELRPLLRNCAVHDMVRFFKQVDGLKACSEWSLGTFEQPQLACQNPALLQAFLEEQLDVYKMYDIEPFFWTWNLPYGKNFQSSWSLKHIAGMEDSYAGGTCE